MGLWIAENVHTRAGPVHGTSLLDDLKSTTKVDQGLANAASHLKRDKNGVVLVPQPSDDPRDPLNWPTWKREAAYLNILFATALVGAIGPLISPGFVVIAREFNVPVNKVAETNAALVLAIGCIMFFQSAIAIKYGRRPVYLAGAVFLFVGCIWSAAKPDLNNLLASRIIQGMGMAPVESIATATIGDLFFVHQRGMRVALWGLSLLGGINLGPLVNGFVIDSLGWKYCFWIITPFFGVSLVTMFLFLPETCYDRPAALSTDMGSSAADAAAFEQSEGVDKLHDSAEKIEQADEGAVTYLPAKTTLQEMKVWSGYVNPEPLWRIFLRPFPLLMSPAVLWGFLTYGIATLLLVLVSVISSLVFSRTYGFTARQTGLVSLSPLIASIIMSVIAGYISDFLTTFMARRNGGVFEPEHRLFLMIPYAVFVILGYAGWALSFRNGDPWIAPVMCYALIKFLSTAAVTYIIDTHRAQTSEAQAIINFLKNLISYFIGVRINGWVLGLGIEKMFYVLAGISAAVALTTIVMYHYGKICRSWVQRNQGLFLI